ncbi:unnamed protein product [Moneuplotes crassus]|uniref:Uncharacterized protein n=1 Tax=Euplotes crassus TaxID=5936 RepID=A0AAD1XGN6_EUPCR|nr:unnamed protein product [Moneuplotes crassus]
MASIILIIKATFIIGIAIMAFVAGILPTIIPWCKGSANVLGIANAFSGGVFLAIAFLHIMPEATEEFSQFMENQSESDGYVSWLKHGNDDSFFPLPFALTFVGYAIILLIDKVVFDTHSLVKDHESGAYHQRDSSKNVEFEMEEYNELNKETNNRKDSLKNKVNNEIDEDEGPQRIQTKFVAKLDHALNWSNTSQKSDSSHQNDDLENGIAGLLITKKENSLLQRDHKHKKKRCACNLAPIILCMALSVHSIFEGIATGLIKEESGLWTFVMAIGAHKWAAAMSLGISMTKNFKDQVGTMIIVLTIFSLATPIGVLLGMIVATQSAIVDVIFSSLAAGTFVYIACSEVIVEEFSVPKYRWVKMFSFLSGATLIVILGFLE